MARTSDKVKEGIHDAAEKVKDVAHNAAGKVKDAGHTVAEKTKDIVHNLGEKIENASRRTPWLRRGVATNGFSNELEKNSIAFPFSRGIMRVAAEPVRTRIRLR
ncbi:MAG: hypothetical protein ACLQGP_23460 [Isosphaeraceae bacterium]